MILLLIYLVIIKALVELTCSSLFFSIITLVVFLKLLFINNCFIQEDHKSSNHAWRWCWWPWQISQDTGQIRRISRSGHAIRSVSGGKKDFLQCTGAGAIFPTFVYSKLHLFLEPSAKTQLLFSFKSVINSILTAVTAQGDSQSDMTPRRLHRGVIAAGCESLRAYRNNSIPRILKNISFIYRT